MLQRTYSPAIVAAALITFSFVLVPPVHAMCDNPPVAVDDEIRTPEQLVVLVDPLANDSDPQGLPLELTVDSSTCPGSTTVDDDLIVLTLTTVLTSSCQITYSIDNGVTTTATATVTVLPGAAFFKDSFESGNTSAWS